MWLDVKIDPNLFVRCHLSKICFRLFELAQYCTHIQYHSNVSWQSQLETRFSILKVFENRESIFEVREPSFEDWVLSFKALEELWPLTRKSFLRLAVLKRIAVQSPFTSCSNGWSYPFKKYCHSFERLELSVQKILPSVRMARAIRSKNIAIRSNGSSYLLKKYCHPFERLELSVQKILSSVRTAQAIRSKMVIRSNGSPPVHKIEESLCSHY